MKVKHWTPVTAVPTANKSTRYVVPWVVYRLCMLHWTMCMQIKRIEIMQRCRHNFFFFKILLVCLSITYIIPFHKFAALSEALRHGHWLELQRMNSRLCPSHWLIHSSRRTARPEMYLFPLFFFYVSTSPPLLKKILSKRQQTETHYHYCL